MVCSIISFHVEKIEINEVVAAYIILSFVAIGRELENPFGDDVNDLPLDSYCKQLSSEIDIITATPPAKMERIMRSNDNLVLYPLSPDGYDKWKDRSVDEIRAALRSKVVVQKTQLQAQQGLEKNAVVQQCSKESA